MMNRKSPSLFAWLAVLPVLLGSGDGHAEGEFFTYQCAAERTVTARPIGNTSLELHWQGASLLLHLTRSTPTAQFTNETWTWTSGGTNGQLAKQGRIVAENCRRVAATSPSVTPRALLGTADAVEGDVFCRTYHCEKLAALPLGHFVESHYRLGAVTNASLVVLQDAESGYVRSVALREFGRGADRLLVQAELVRLATGQAVDRAFLESLREQHEATVQTASGTYQLTWPVLDIGGATEARLTVTRSPYP